MLESTQEHTTQTSNPVHILTEAEFIKTHGLAFYQKYPTREAFIEAQNKRVDERLSKTGLKSDPQIFIDNREKFVETMTRDFYDNQGYLHFLRFFYARKLKVDVNELNKSMRKMAKGIAIVPAYRSENGRTQFKSHGADQGRAIINNLSYKEIATCKKGHPVDILTWDAYNDATDVKHLMRPAYWKNIANGDFDKPTLQESREANYDLVSKLIAMFCDRASVFRSSVYAAIINHYTPTAEHSLHLVGSWNTPTLAASALMRLKHQVIIDVIPRQKEVGEFIYNNFIPKSLTNQKHKYDFIICPSEQLQNRLNFRETYKDYFDVQLFSPVYFSTELYNSVDGDAGEQSVDSFPQYDGWVEGYFHETIKTAYEVMKPGSTFILVISDFEYQDEVTKKWHYISHDMLEITSLYFKPVETADLILTSGSGMTNKAAKEKRRAERKALFSEHVHVFTKDVNYHSSQEANRAVFKPKSYDTRLNGQTAVLDTEGDNEQEQFED
jgi:hypothetical protein